MTLKDILKEHPEWGDLPVAIYCNDGTYEMEGESATVYKAHTRDDPESDPESCPPGTYPVVVFAGN